MEFIWDFSIISSFFENWLLIEAENEVMADILSREDRQSLKII